MIGNNGPNDNGNGNNGGDVPANEPASPRHLPRDASEPPGRPNGRRRGKMPRKNKKEDGRGRPAKEVNTLRLYRMIRDGYTMVEAAAVLRVSDDTLKRNFADVIDHARAKRQGRLRAKQFEVAMGGNPQMLIWCGKQDLGQKDRVDHTTNDAPIVQHLHGVSMAQLHGPGNGRNTNGG